MVQEIMVEEVEETRVCNWGIKGTMVQAEGGVIHPDSLAAQLATIASRLESIVSQLKGDVAEIKSMMFRSPHQCNNQDMVTEETPDNGPSGDKDRFEHVLDVQLKTEDRSENVFDVQSEIEDQSKHVFGSQLKIRDSIIEDGVCCMNEYKNPTTTPRDGAQLKHMDIANSVQLKIGVGGQFKIRYSDQFNRSIEDKKLLHTNLSLAQMISRADGNAKCVKAGRWNGPDYLKIGNRGYTCPHRVWVGPLTHSKVIAYWLSIGLSSIAVVKADDLWKNTVRRLVEAEISITIEWLIAWCNYPLEEAEKL